MKFNKEIALTIMLFFIVPIFLSADIHSNETSQSSDTNFHSTYYEENSRCFEPKSKIYLPESYYSSTEEPSPESVINTGTLNPTIVEQVGYQNIGDFVARTDTGINLLQEFPIDDENGWQASIAEIDIWNLNRLYIQNGTVDEGYPGINVNPSGNVTYHPLGWDAYSNDTTAYTDDAQLAGYDVSNGGYVIVESQGGKVGQQAFGHAAGTRIVWSQLVYNNPYTEDFILNFDYFYLRGPIDGLTGLHDITGNCSIVIFINGANVWNMSLLLLTQRGTWLNTGDIPISVPGLPSVFLFELGLIIDESMVLNKEYDYDGDPLHLPDGIVNAYSITAYIDDIILTGVMSPEFDQLEFQMNIGDFSSPITGSLGVGNSSITNPDYWTTGPVSLVISANTSVIFEYNARLFCHRFLNSSWTNDIHEKGVHYSISYDESAELDIFTYLGFIGVYDELQLRIYCPVDWQNFTVYNSFLNDVTSSCYIESGYVLIPTILLGVLGWWQIHCQSPNYAGHATIERYDDVLPGYIEETEFRSDDNARLSVYIENSGTEPHLSDPVNFTWVMPDSSIWHESSTTSNLVGSADSSSITFGPTNTTAGYWGILYLWTNGTELAYSCALFTLKHEATLELVYSDLGTVVGQPVTVVLRFYDIENGQFILNDGTEIIGTWAAGNVIFEPNVVKNWWQADFDTLLVGAGDFEVSIVSLAPYFETSPLIVTITSQYLTILDTPNGPLQPLIYGHEYSFNFVYKIDYDESGVDDALVEVLEEGSDWVTVTNTGNGHYNVSLIPLGIGDYGIRLQFSKEGYENQTHYLSFLVNKVPIKVNFLTLLSGPELGPLLIEIEVLEVDTNQPVIGANVTLNILSKGGVLYASETMVEEADGIYSTTIIMPIAGGVTHSAIIFVQKDNYELTQIFSDTLVPTVDTNARLVQAIMNYSTQIAFMVGVVGIVAGGQKYYSRKRLAKQAKARVIKARFTDANNLLGIIVLHKLSGVPIYSKILKGGLEEGMLSAFITAIMHFRSEFEVIGSTDDYKILPISDIVRAVPTQNLVCAFITITSASLGQETRMISFTRAIGMMLDEALAQRPTKVADAKTVKTLEWLFDDFVDGALLRDYQIGEKQLPKHLRCIEEVMKLDSSAETFKLINLLRLLESCGIHEDDAYILIMEALELEYILPIYHYNEDSSVDESSSS
ncbi:hypothetical protein EU527_10285 [Candidatus Thorarchaeota archaeon]|nr:MAG: hypothetical protein EU527_10285 [Candidatus Thorarchaeota archaeon]